MKYFISALLLFLSLQSLTQKSAENRKFIVGKWVSIDDKNYTITVTKSNFIEYYEKKEIDRFLYKIDKDKLTKTGADNEVYEYEIMGLSKTNLTLIYLGRGNLLKFKRVK